MELMQTVAQTCLIAFMVGAIFGGVVATHLVTRREVVEKEQEPVKVKSKHSDGW